MNVNWKEELEEYGDLHNEDCDVNLEEGSFDGCHCEHMKMIKAFISTEIIEKLIKDAGDITDNDMKVEQRLRDKWLP